MDGGSPQSGTGLFRPSLSAEPLNFALPQSMLVLRIRSWDSPCQPAGTGQGGLHEQMWPCAGQPIGNGNLHGGGFFTPAAPDKQAFCEKGEDDYGLSGNEKRGGNLTEPSFRASAGQLRAEARNLIGQLVRRAHAGAGKPDVQCSSGPASADPTSMRN